MTEVELLFTLSISHFWARNAVEHKNYATTENAVGFGLALTKIYIHILKIPNALKGIHHQL